MRGRSEVTRGARCRRCLLPALERTPPLASPSLTPANASVAAACARPRSPRRTPRRRSTLGAIVADSSPSLVPPSRFRPSVRPVRSATPSPARTRGRMRGGAVTNPRENAWGCGDARLWISCGRCSREGCSTMLGLARLGFRASVDSTPLEPLLPGCDTCCRRPWARHHHARWPLLPSPPTGRMRRVRSPPPSLLLFLLFFLFAGADSARHLRAAAGQEDDAAPTGSMFRCWRKP